MARRGGPSMEEFGQSIDALAVVCGHAGIPNLVMAGPLSRPSMNTASKNGHDAQLVPMGIVRFDEICSPVAFRRDEGVEAKRGTTQCSWMAGTTARP